MKRMRYWRETICTVIALLGFVVMIGTIGAADVDRISFGRLVWQSALGLAMFVGGGTLGGFFR